jgi:hypothetical protein
MVFYFAKSTIKYGLKVFFDIMGSPYLDNKKNIKSNLIKKTPYEMIKMKRKTIEGPKK